jgi:glutamate-ammonia-ligase adenylyltransferase
MTSSLMHNADSTALADGLTRALAHSRFVRHSAPAELGADALSEAGRAGLLALAQAPWDRARMQAQLAELLPAGPLDAAALAAALRRLRRRVLLGTLVRDASGIAPLAEVTGAMTTLAELAVARALGWHGPDLAAQHGVPSAADGVPQDLLVVAMGKGGGGELNVSSDLDLVFVYEREGETQAAAGQRALSNHEFFERLGRRLIGALSEVTAAGFVFRVDMRLRPNGDAGPLAVSTDMLEEYLVRQGRTWERLAWLKARVLPVPVFTDAAQFEGQVRALARVVKPFVYRRYLDFGAVAALRELHALIRAETSRKSAARQGGRADHDANIKLGRGGIREIEFIVQTYQVMRGGREPRLQGRATLEMLTVLADLGVLAADTAQTLAQDYTWLRRLEHALQYVDDAQTHLLPDTDAACADAAALLQMTPAALRSACADARARVASRFDGVFALPPALVAEPAGLSEDDWRQRLAPAAVDPQLAARMMSLLASRRVAVGGDSARQAIERLLLHGLAGIVQRAAAPGAARDVGVEEVLKRFIQLLEVLAGRSTYLALLAQYPQARERVLDLLAASRWATDYLARHPLLLDELLDDRLQPAHEDWASWAADVEARLIAPDDGDDHTELRMNLLREAHHVQLFRLLLADLAGALSVEALADQLAALADQTLMLALGSAWAALPRRHRLAPAFAIVAYGKLGGKELGYASDLDLIFLYDDPDPDAPEVYAALVRRLMNWLTAQTASGVLFEVDLRLRPNGNAGLLVSSFDAFARYQRNVDGQGAWTWEHQALTRARFVCGDAALGERFETLRAEILARPRDAAALRVDVRAMREKMHAGHPNRSAAFDLKHDRGGMVDVEFIVQTLVLAHAHRHARLLGNLGNIALLRIAGALGLIDAALAARAAAAYRRYRALQHRLRLNGAELARVPPGEVAAEVAWVTALWDQVLAEPPAPSV